MHGCRDNQAGTNEHENSSLYPSCTIAQCSYSFYARGRMHEKDTYIVTDDEPRISASPSVCCAPSYGDAHGRVLIPRTTARKGMRQGRSPSLGKETPTLCVGPGVLKAPKETTYLVENSLEGVTVLMGRNLEGVAYLEGRNSLEGGDNLVLRGIILSVLRMKYLEGDCEEGRRWWRGGRTRRRMSKDRASAQYLYSPRARGQPLDDPDGVRNTWLWMEIGRTGRELGRRPRSLALAATGSECSHWLVGIQRSSARQHGATDSVCIW
ncbi:hypothetical protein C8Q78DRAFT_688247 [Trametes maxima]|nr:hypothetical protein C8Q78DRAFT_688247 [Trametes maxima]